MRELGRRGRLRVRGQRFAVGDTFPDADGCNSCTCEEDGKVSCTLIACSPVDGCGSGDACADDEYCQHAANAGCNDSAGSCRAKPEACDAIYKPVCGCDGKTYSSDCDAAMNGVAVEAEGECDGGTDPKGCDYGGKHFEPGASFPSTDGCNTCTCGEGGSVGCTKRACAPTGTCGGLIGGACAKDEYCSYPEDAICGAADATGQCTKKPEFCTEQYEPVCGCDGKTYGNACSAGSAGVSVAKQGECDDTGSGGGSCKLGDTEFEAGANVICSDGCNHCSCGQDGRWISTLAACAPLPKIELCDESEKSEGLDVSALYRDGDALALSISYGGGCFEHTFKLCHSGVWLESSPVQTPIRVVDTTGKVDSCLALPTVQRVFDLTPLRELYRKNYPGGPNTVLLNVGKEQVEYSF